MTRTFRRDEFDIADVGTGRRGAHRARANPFVAVVPLVLVTVAVVAIIVAAMTLLGGSPTTSAEVPGAGAGAGSPGASEPAPDPSGTPSTGPEPDEPAPSEPAPSEPAPPASVDLSLPVSVLNGTRTSGLAGAAAERLNVAGYNVVSTDNFRQGTPPTTTVYYSVEESSATAEAIAGELGVVRTELDAARGEGIVVILGADYTP